MSCRKDAAGRRIYNVDAASRRVWRMPSKTTLPQMTDRPNRTRRSTEKANGSLPPRVDKDRIAAAVREILAAVGEDPDREGLRDTPDRVARMYEEMFAGLHKDPAELLRKTFTEKYDEIVLVKDISFESMCEHHLLPFFGKA